MEMAVEKEGDSGGWFQHVGSFVYNPLLFMKDTSEADDQTVLAKAGLDSVIYLHILHAFLALFMALSVVGVLVLLPLNLYTARKPWVGVDSFLLSTANGFSDPNSGLLPHTLFSIFTACAMVAVVFVLRDFLVTACRKQLGNKDGTPPVQAYTVELRGLRLHPPVSAEELKPLAEAAAPGRLLAISGALDVADMVDRVEKTRELRKQLARYRQQHDNDRARPTVQTGALRWIGMGQEEDAITLLEKQIGEAHKEVEKMRLSKGRFGAGTAFITFTKRPAAVAFIERFKDAEQARKACGHPTIGKGQDFICNDTSKWEVELAGRPEDIYWRNLKSSTMHRMVLTVGAFVFMVVLLAFLVTPIFFVQILLEVGGVVTEATGGKVATNTTVEEVNEAKGEMEQSDLSSTLEKAHQEKAGVQAWTAIVLAFLWPFLVLVINSVIMPTLVRFLSKHLGQRYVSAMQRSTFNFLFFFMVLNILILPSLALEGLDQLLSVTSTDRVYALLGQVVIYGSSTSFFVDYIAQSALLGSAFCFIYHTTSPAIAAMRGSGGKQQPGWEFDFPLCYSSLLSVLAIGLVFSVAVPLVLPCVLLFLAVRLYTDKWQLLSVHSPERVDPAPESTASAVLVSILVVTAVSMVAFASWLSIEGAGALALWPFLVAVCLLVFVGVPTTRHQFVTISNKWRPSKDDSPDTWETDAPPAYANAYDNPYLQEDADRTVGV